MLFVFLPADRDLLQPFLGELLLQPLNYRIRFNGHKGIAAEDTGLDVGIELVQIAQYKVKSRGALVTVVLGGEEGVHTSFLLTGDAERTAEADILAAGYDLSSSVLKVGHHGSDTSTSYPFLREVMPEYAVIQVGKGNSYGHPTEDTLSKLRDADVKVYRNDLQGTIICTSDGESVSFITEKNESIQTNPTVTVMPEQNDVGEYIGNKNSKKFHLPTCKTLPAEKNQVFFESRQDAVDAGYDPCGNCKP